MLLHFTLGIAKQNVLWPRPSVCVSVPCLIPTVLYRPGCNFGKWYGVSRSCALLGGFAVSVRVSLLWQLMCLMQIVIEDGYAYTVLRNSSWNVYQGFNCLKCWEVKVILLVWNSNVFFHHCTNFVCIVTEVSALKLLGDWCHQTPCPNPCLPKRNACMSL